MTKALRWMLVAMIAIGGFLGTGAFARADVENSAADNAQEGDNEAETDQSGNASSGDAVGGQVVGVVSAGDTSVDATNRSEDVDIDTGDAEARNDAAAFVGHNQSFDLDVFAADINNVAADNLQEGDNSYDVVQAADATSGDGVGGQVIGVVTAAGGSADIVAANTSEDIDIETGDAEAFNNAAAFVGLNISTFTDVSSADVENSAGRNVQDGDNEGSADQSASSGSGDGVGGQVIGVVSAGDTSLDATNRSEDVDIETGDTFARNDSAMFVGHNIAFFTDVFAADVNGVFAENLQDGDNEKSVVQAADATSGDAVGGQVAGVVTSAGGSADLVLANTSEDIDTETGDADVFNNDEAFVGLNISTFTDI